MIPDDSELRALLAHMAALRDKPRKTGSLREDVNRLERVVQALTAEVAALKQQLHRVSAIGHPLPRPEEP